MDLSSMFQNLGPAGGAIMTGMQAGDAANEQKSMQAYRQAQMEDIMQKTAQQAELHPLELQTKKQLLDMRYEAVKIGDTANLKIYSGQSRSHNMPGGDDYPTALGLALWGIKIPEIPILFALARGAMTREMDI